MKHSASLGMSNPDSKLMIFLDHCTALVLTNFLWILCCLPVVTAGAATRAMFCNLRAHLRDEASGPAVFFRAFRQDFFRSCGIGVGLMLMALLLLTGVLTVLGSGIPGTMPMLGIIGSVALITLLFGSMVFPLMSCTSLPLSRLVLTALTLSIGYLPRMIPVAMLNLIPVGMVLFFTGFFLRISAFWALMGFALIAMLDLRLLNPVLDSLC